MQIQRRYRDCYLDIRKSKEEFEYTAMPNHQPNETIDQPTPRKWGKDAPCRDSGLAREGKHRKRKRRRKIETRRKIAIPKDRNTERPPLRKGKNVVQQKGRPWRYNHTFCCELCPSKTNGTWGARWNQHTRRTRVPDSERREYPVPKLVCDNLTHPPTISYC